MSLPTITSADTTGKGVVGLPDSPGLSATMMQNKFDQLVNEVVIPKFNALSEEAEERIGSIETVNTFTFATSAWGNNTHTKYTKKATVSTDKFADNFIPIVVEMIPVDGTAYFSEGEEEAREILNPNVDIDASGITVYAEDTPSVSIKFRVRGVAIT